MPSRARRHPPMLQRSTLRPVFDMVGFGMNRLPQLSASLESKTSLSAEEVGFAVEGLLDPSQTEESKAEFLVALARKGETPKEIAGFAMELRTRAVDPQISPSQHGGILFDVVGTGADMAHTFNISSCTIFVAAAAGVAVAKHGNRAITSQVRQLPTC